MKIILKERNKIIWGKDAEILENLKNAFFCFIFKCLKFFKNFSEITEETKKEMVEGWK
jgi:hypothetical protein